LDATFEYDRASSKPTDLQKEIKMFKNRFILVIGIVSLLLMTMAVSKPFSNASPVSVAGANDFYQRHPDWTWASSNRSAAIPVTGAADLSDYFLRHPELIPSTVVTIDTSDYFLRHPELVPAIGVAIDTSDYFLRHPELIGK
jgi:hypothetical protein